MLMLLLVACHGRCVDHEETVPLGPNDRALSNGRYAAEECADLCPPADELAEESNWLGDLTECIVHTRDESVDCRYQVYCK